MLRNDVGLTIDYFTGAVCHYRIAVCCRFATDLIKAPGRRLKLVTECYGNCGLAGSSDGQVPQCTYKDPGGGGDGFHIGGLGDGDIDIISVILTL